MDGAPRADGKGAPGAAMTEAKSLPKSRRGQSKSAACACVGLSDAKVLSFELGSEHQHIRG